MSFNTNLIARYMGALSNSGRRTANMAGFYKGLQSAGAAIFWRLDGVHTEFNIMFAATVSLQFSFTCIGLVANDVNFSGVFVPPPS